MEIDALTAIAAMGVASFICRAGGYWAMRFVRPTPRLEAVLAAMPVCTLAAILVPVMLRHGPAEWAGLAGALAVTRLSGNELAGAGAGVGLVATLRLVSG